MEGNIPEFPANQLLRPWLAAMLLIVGCLFIYHESLASGFVMFDDDINFVYNQDFGPLNGIRLRWIATEHSVMMRYVPVGWFVCCAIASIGGLDPFWFHLASLVLHACACVVFYFVLARVAHWFGPRESTQATARRLSLLPFVCAAVWGWHPLRVETVAWVTTLIYLLATLLGLMALGLFLRSLEKPPPCRGARSMSVILFAAALLSHPAAMAFFPLLAACAVVWQLQNGDRSSPGGFARVRGLGKTLLPFAIAGVLDLAVTLAVRQLGSVVPQAATPSLDEFGIAQRLAQTSAVLVHFIGKTLWPSSLSPAYPLLETVTPTSPLFFLSVVACAVLLVASVLLLRRQAKIGLFAVATLAAAAPFLGWQEHPFYPSDRYTHIPSLGLVLCLLAAVYVSRGARRIVLGVLPAIIGGLLPLFVVLSLR
ncbi:MAG: hypothetical protein JWM88_3180, partial [Verrucomicrobia bacterium]|nr:hypothetical protein [Verrucomicrobiota bacterium]